MKFYNAMKHCLAVVVFAALCIIPAKAQQQEELRSSPLSAMESEAVAYQMSDWFNGRFKKSTDDKDVYEAFSDSIKNMISSVSVTEAAEEPAEEAAE